MTSLVPGILIVEDERLVAMDIRNTLQRLGYQVVGIATSGQQALDQIAQQQPDLVLMDIRLRGSLDGIQTVEQFQTRFDIPVVYLTAYADDTTLERARRTGPYGYIMKPFDEQALRITIDIALERHHRDQQTRISEQWLNTLLTTMGEAVLATDIEGQVTFLNPAAEQLVGISWTEIVGKPVTEVLPLHHAATRARLDHPILQTLRHGEGMRLPRDTLLITPDGKECFIDDSITPIKTVFNTVIGVVMVFHDNTDHYTYEAEIERMAFTDPLTNLPNRRRLFDVGTAALSVSQVSGRVTLLYIDLDRFKTVNDTFGHHVGDELLVQVASRLRAPLETEVLLARLGGDEFALLLTGTDSAQAAAVSQQLLTAIRAPFMLSDKLIHLDASIGIAMAEDSDMAFSTLLTQADTAMYQAKATRSGVQVYHIGMLPQIYHFQLESDLRGALTAEALVLVYQPIRDVQTNAIVAVEALVRWPHPGHGLLTPERFLPLAEEINLMQHLDRWVLRTAITQLADWYTQGIKLCMSINLSAQTLQDHALVAEVAALLEGTGVPATQIILELTEQSALRDPVQVQQVFEGLRALGVRIALDDFGTGYTSLSQLRQGSFDIIKVDRSYTQGLGRESKDEAAVQALLSIGQGFGLWVIVEGLEESAQLVWLQKAGCSHVQGYLTGRPVSAEQIEKWLDEQAPVTGTLGPDQHSGVGEEHPENKSTSEDPSDEGHHV